jgi:hypothetical protein
MNVIYIIIMVETLLLLILTVVGYLLYIKTNQRINTLKKNIRNLSNLSQYFPDIFGNGEQVTNNTSEELTMKQDVLNKLISELERVSERLDIMEEKVKEKRLDKETVNKVLILVNQGFSAAEIAPKLNIPIGEIELVIKLRRYLSSTVKERL